MPKGENLTIECQVFLLQNTYYFEICNQKERAELLRRIYKAFFSKDDEEGFMTVVSGIKKRKKQANQSLIKCVYSLLFHLHRKTW